MIECVGFTGTRNGMTKVQANRIIELIDSLDSVFEVRHGDCVGADKQFHDLVRERLSCDIVSHPPRSDKFRAFCDADVVLPVDDYLKRNVAIVRASDMVFAAPDSKFEQIRSGTWATVRECARQNTTCVIVFDDGTVVVEVNRADVKTES